MERQIGFPLEPAVSPQSTPRSVRRRANELDGATWTRYSISIWSDIKKTPEEIRLGHPAIFPFQLVKRLIQCFTTDQDRVVLDLFMGVGSTVLAAEALGKTGIGIEISEEFVRKAKARPSLPSFSDNSNIQRGQRIIHHGDANDLLKYVEPRSVDLVVTSPPYWDILLQKRTADYKPIRHYGQEEKDLGKIRKYEDFLFALKKVLKLIWDVLKPGKFCCIVVMDLRKKDKLYPFHADIINRMEQLNFTLEDIIIWDRSHEYSNLRPLGYPSVFRVNKVHEYILIFRKPSEPIGHLPQVNAVSL